MYTKQPFLLDALRFCEFFAMIVGVIKLNSLRKSYWKWLVYYLIYIFIYEIISSYISTELKISIRVYLALIQIPIEFIFFYWLYSIKSLRNRRLFWILSIIYLFSLILEHNLTTKVFAFKSLNNIIGTLLLLILVVLEFIRQIKSDSIIKFKESKMFYINIGVILFYVGNMPFMGLYYSILTYPEIWNKYNIYFLVSNCIMYLLFAASFIWGKTK